MRVGYFGPRGTFTEEALNAALPTESRNAIPYPTIPDTVMAVHGQAVELALVPIENSLEGAVNATLDTLAFETEDVFIVGELVLTIRHCLIARQPLAAAAVEVVVSHPQVLGQCARFLRSELPQAQVVAASSSAEAVRQVADHPGRWAALGNQLAAELYGCVVLREGVEDVAGNQTRFVWLAREVEAVAAGHADAVAQLGLLGDRGPWKTAIVFWGPGSETPGWLVDCLSEFARREVNLTRIESRPRKQALGSYMFFVDLEGRAHDPQVAQALAGLRRHVEMLRVLGSFPMV